jgi:hypothetical protein
LAARVGGARPGFGALYPHTERGCVSKHIAAASFATALRAGPATAQTATTNTADASGNAATMPKEGEWRASKLVGLEGEARIVAEIIRAPDKSRNMRARPLLRTTLGIRPRANFIWDKWPIRHPEVLAGFGEPRRMNRPQTGPSPSEARKSSHLRVTVRDSQRSGFNDSIPLTPPASRP